MWRRKDEVHARMVEAMATLGQVDPERARRWNGSEAGLHELQAEAAGLDGWFPVEGRAGLASASDMSGWMGERLAEPMARPLGDEGVWA